MFHFSHMPKGLPMCTIKTWLASDLQWEKPGSVQICLASPGCGVWITACVTERTASLLCPYPLRGQKRMSDQWLPQSFCESFALPLIFFRM